MQHIFQSNASLWPLGIRILQTGRSTAMPFTVTLAIGVTFHAPFRREFFLSTSKRVREKSLRLNKSRRATDTLRRSQFISPFGDSRAASGNGRSSLSERVYQALKHDIVRGVYPAGEALGEKALAHRYKGSRTPVREAAVRLQQENLLRIVPNRGYFVSSMTIAWLNEIYEFRAAIEGACAELAARKANDPKLLDELTHLAQTEYETHDRLSYEKFIAADTALHIGIARLTRNPMLVRAVSDMRCHMERVMYAAIDIGYYGEAPVQEHSEIIHAIRRQDDDLARRLMYDHIIQSRGKVLGLASGGRRPA
jgi:DNA-binding GntR family transcriptional regulator